MKFAGTWQTMRLWVRAASVLKTDPLSRSFIHNCFIDPCLVISLWLELCADFVMLAGASRSVSAAGPENSAAAAARRNRFLWTALSTYTAKSQSDIHTIIILLKLFIHFNPKRSFSLIAPHAPCDWPLRNIRQH